MIKLEILKLRLLLLIAELLWSWMTAARRDAETGRLVDPTTDEVTFLETFARLREGIDQVDEGGRIG